MNCNKLFFLIAICLFTFLSISCRQNYPDEDLIIRYTVENSIKFDNNNEFSIIVMRTPVLSCGAGLQKYNYTHVLENSKKEFEPPVYVLYDFELILFDIDSSLYENFHQIKGSSFVLDSYAFPYTPTSFQIKNKKIVKWKEFSN